MHTKVTKEQKEVIKKADFAWFLFLLFITILYLFLILAFNKCIKKIFLIFKIIVNNCFCN